MYYYKSVSKFNNNQNFIVRKNVIETEIFYSLTLLENVLHRTAESQAMHHNGGWKTVGVHADSHRSYVSGPVQFVFSLVFPSRQ